MNGRCWKICAVLMFFSLISLYWGRQYVFGFLLGEVISILIYKRNELFWNEVVDTGVSGKGTGSMHFAVNFAMMGLPMLAAVFVPDYLNIFTVAAGMMLIKAAVVIDTLTAGKE
ncbi:MAG: hypothetical protein K6D03_02600 [Solobacterium sp.]|nr:hypothetical protein [Solobacterium sp.]